MILNRALCETAGDPRKRTQGALAAAFTYLQACQGTSRLDVSQPFSRGRLSTNGEKVYRARSSNTTNAAKSMERRQRSLKAVVYCWIDFLTNLV